MKNVALANDTKVLDLMVISVMNKAIVQGDEKRINWFMEQLFGKIKELREVSVKAEIEVNPNFDLKKLSNEELEKLKQLTFKMEE